MLTNIKCILFFLLLIYHIEISLNASLSLQEQKKYKNLIEGQGLFSGDDDVEVLTIENFDNRVYGQKNAWLVEFYNSWCGFCQRFAPSWKALATDVKAWKGAVNIAAFDCSDDDNNAICRDFEIMAYPTLKYFHEDYIKDAKNLGENVAKGGDFEEHKKNLIIKLLSEQENDRGIFMPLLLPYEHNNILHLFDKSNVNTKYMFLIIDEPGSNLGPQITLDFQAYKELGIRYAFKDNEELVKNVEAKKFPFVMVISDHNKSHVFPDILQTRTSIRDTIIEYVKPNIIIPLQQSKSDIFTGKWIDAEVPDISSLYEAKSRKALRDKVKKMGDVVFQVDLESALRYSLKHEVGAIKTISDEKYAALKQYVNVLVKYFPFGLEGKQFLVELQDNIKSKISVTGAEIANLVKTYDEDENKRVFSSSHQWITCEGSSPERRGYPCGLWKLFHYLTVQASEGNSDPKEVLHAMHDYIKNFFGCADCSKHFQEMAVRKDLEGVSSLDSAILWLWMAHNDVNKRLSGDQTEDPEFPKKQFPIIENCKQCRSGESWDYIEVLKYLKDKYSSVNIRYIGAGSSFLHPELSLPRTRSHSIIGQIDSSMCFILYFISFVLIILLIRLFLKRGYRKKLYMHDLLGKV